MLICRPSNTWPYSKDCGVNRKGGCSLWSFSHSQMNDVWTGVQIYSCKNIRTLWIYVAMPWRQNAVCSSSKRIPFNMLFNTEIDSKTSENKTSKEHLPCHRIPSSHAHEGGLPKIHHAVPAFFAFPGCCRPFHLGSSSPFNDKNSR